MPGKTRVRRRGQKRVRVPEIPDQKMRALRRLSRRPKNCPRENRQSSTQRKRTAVRGSQTRQNAAPPQNAAPELRADARRPWPNNAAVNSLRARPVHESSRSNAAFALQPMKTSPTTSRTVKIFAFVKRRWKASADEPEPLL